MDLKLVPIWTSDFVDTHSVKVCLYFLATVQNLMGDGSIFSVVCPCIEISKALSMSISQGVFQIQQRLKRSLCNIWENCMSNEWLSPKYGQSRDLVQFYQELEMDYSLRKSEPSRLTKFTDLFDKMPNSENKKILVEGKYLPYIKKDTPHFLLATDLFLYCGQCFYIGDLHTSLCIHTSSKCPLLKVIILLKY